MRKNLLKTLLAICCLSAAGAGYSQQLAFPGAEGFGKYAQGPRAASSKEVYHVTNLNDSGTGSFRDAVSKPGRYVIFDVAGVIKINSAIVVSSNTYIAGQTAPGEGITIYGDGISFSGASNSICRYLRVRAGKNSTREDAFGLSNGQNIIFDHVSVAWGVDETFSVTSDGKNGGSKNITIQNCIISQGLLGHSAGGLCEPDGDITVYRTLFIDNSTRNFKMKGTTQYVNNIVYNWKNAAYIMGGNSSSSHYANAIGNYFIVGPGGGKQAFKDGNLKYNIYAEDNFLDENANGILDGSLLDESGYGGPPAFMTQPFDYPELSKVVPAAELVDELIGTVGASLPYRDNLDWYILDELRSLGKKGAFISSESELNIGIPTTWNMWTGTSRTDTDGDGIPDEWETIIGSDPNVADATAMTSNNYTNIENYINAITAANSQYYLKAPISLQSGTITQNEIQLTWLNVTENENGYIIEEKIDGSFVEIDRVEKDATSYTATGLEPESTHIYRVKAFDDTTTTGPTNELTVKTKPVPVNVENPDTFVPDAVWTGENSGEWNYLAANWNTSSGLFESGQKILFDESGTNKEVTITENIDQSTMFVKGNADYSFSGTGVIGGTGSVNKTGKGTLILPDNNTYTGATVIWDGTIEINKLADGGQPSSIGASPNYDFNWVWNGGTIRYTGGSVSTDRNIALENTTVFEVADANATIKTTGIIGGTGDFVKDGAGAVYSTFGKNTYTGNTIVKGGVYELNGNNGSIGIKGSLILEGGRFRTTGGADGKDGIYDFPIIVNGDKMSYFDITRNSTVNSTFSGTGDLTIEFNWVREAFKGNWDNYYGTLTLAQGPKATSTGMWFLINNETNGAGVPNASIVLKDGVRIVGGKSTSTYRFGGLSGNSGTYLQGVYVKNNTGSVTWAVGGLGTDEEFNGSITNEASSSSYTGGKTSIVKEGNGYWRLTANNIYNGTTTVNGGNLIINGAQTGTGAVTVNNGGTLSGKGSLAASVTVKDGGTIDPGDLGTGTFTIKNAVTFESGSILNIDVNRTDKTNDKLTSTGAVTIAGDLNLNLMDGSFANGDEITLMSAGSYSGAFANITPATPGNDLYWDTTDLYTSGKLRVTDDNTGIAEDGIYEFITSANGCIVIEGLIAPKAISVYSTSGVLVHTTVTASGCNIAVQPGIYFVKVGTKTTKILVQ